MNKILIVYYADEKLYDTHQVLVGEDIELVKESELGSDQIPRFAIVDNAEKMHELRNKFEEKKWQVKFIFSGRNYNIQDFFDLDGVMLLDPFMFSNTIGTVLIKRAIATTPGIQLQETFGGNFDKYYTYKITNIYRLGYFADLVCKDAAGQKLNFIAIRSFFDHAMILNSYLVDLGLANFPCELEYTFKDNNFVLMLHLGVSDLKQSQLIESLGEENLKNPLSSLLKSCFKQTDYLDVLIHPTAKRLSIMGLWLSNDERINLVTQSISINTVSENVSKQNKIDHESNPFNYDFDHQQDPKELEELDNSELPNLPGAHKILEKMDKDSVFHKEEGLLEEMTSFVQNQIELNNVGVDDPSQVVNVSDLNLDEVKKILEGYPDQELIQRFRETDEEILTVLVTSGKNAESLIQIVKSKLANDDEDIKLKLSSAAEEISNQIVMGGSLFQEKLGSDIQIVSSSLKDKDANEILVNPGIIFEESELNIDGQVINYSPSEKDEIIQTVQNTFDELLLSPDFQVLSKEEQHKVIEKEFKQIIQNKIPRGSDETQTVKIAMGNIQKDIVTKFSSKGERLGSDQQVELITSSILKNAKAITTGIKGDKLLEQAVGEIVDKMCVPDEQKLAFKKNIQQKMNKEKDQITVEGDSLNELDTFEKDFDSSEEAEQIGLVEDVEELDHDEYHMENQSDESEKIKNNVGSIRFSKDKTADDNDTTIISGDFEDKEQDFNVKITSTNGKKNKNSTDKIIISSSNAVEEDDGYKVVQGKGLSANDEGYKISQRSANGKDNSKKQSADIQVADNSLLLKKIEDLEKKLKAERAQIREMEKAKNIAKEKVKVVRESVAEITKEIKEPDATVIATDPEQMNAVETEIKSASGLSEMQRTKMLEVIEKEKQMNLKYAEMHEAYRKTKAALDTVENKYAAEIEELERSNRHKEHLIDQVKTKNSNAERDHHMELKRITFDLKKQAQRTSTLEVDRYKQKAISLEREKNAMKRMLDDLKNSVSKEKVKIIEQEVKTSPKIAEFEAQKKRVEVKLTVVESELKDLKKTMIAKDTAAKEVGEQRIKLESEMNKWKKDALTKQSEVEKAISDRKRMEEELTLFKKKYDETLKVAHVEKKNEQSAAQAIQDSKASIANVKQAEDKILSLKEEMAKEKVHLNKELAKEKEQLEEMKKSYLTEANKVKALETKMKEMAATIDEQTAALKANDAAVAEAASKGTGGSASSGTKDLSALVTKNRILEETSKKVTKDFNDTKAKLDEAKKEIANLTKKTNETQFKLQEKEKLAEKLQNELKAIKDKEADSKKKDADAAKKAA